LDPATHIGRGRLGSGKGGLIGRFHLLLLREGLSSFTFSPSRVPHLEEKEDAFLALIVVLISATVVGWVSMYDEKGSAKYAKDVVRQKSISLSQHL